MRLLFTTVPGSGHLHPLVPLARTLRGRGHATAFATAPRFCPAVESSGFAAFPAGRDWLGSEARPGQDALSSLRRFVDVGGEMVSDLLSVAERFRPDVIVREQAELGGWIAAALLGLPSVVHGVNVRWSHAFLRAAAGEIDHQRTRHGLPSDPELSDFFGDVFLDVVPPSFQPPGLRRLPAAYPLRPPIFDRSGPEGLPAWLAKRQDRPLIYATLGTIFNRTRRVFSATLAALRDEPVELVLTLGRNVDPRELGEQPAHVHVERYVPQSLILPHCSAVITHAGFNTTMASLSHGLPLCCLPLGADQLANAARCAELGAGISCAPIDREGRSGGPIDPDRLEPDTVRAAVQHLLAEDRFRVQAARLRTEIEAMPAPEAASRIVERLVPTHNV
jgi:UDP:flavonoid glycosyltransferase YjiC (YdhE family)